MTNEKEIIEPTPYIAPPELGDMYLKFTDEAQSIEVLFTAVQVEVPVMKVEDVTVYLVQGEPDADGDREDYRTEQPKEGAVILDSWTEQSHVFSHNEVQTELRPKYPTLSIDVIGYISAPSGDKAKDADGNEVDVYTFLDGWHVNTRGPMPLEFETFSVHPEHPRRVWA